MNFAPLPTDADFETVGENLYHYPTAEALAYVEKLTGATDTPMAWRTFDDKKADARLTRTLYGSLAEHFEELRRLNRKGAGVFAVVNRVRPGGTADADVTDLRACFIDWDGGTASAPTPALAPSLIVDSANGPHFYWRLSEGEDQGRFRETQSALAAFYGSDPSVKNESRVMRVPGFLHNKTEPRPVTLSERSEERYTLNEIAKAHPVEAKLAPKLSPRLGNFELRGEMFGWVNKAVTRAREAIQADRAAHRNDFAAWAVCQMRDSMAPLIGREPTAEDLGPFAEELRARLSDLKPGEPYTNRQMQLVLQGHLGKGVRPKAVGPTAEPSDGWPLPTFSTWGELREADLPPFRGLLGGQLFARQTVNMIAGRRGSKKTYASLYLATRFAMGEPFGVLSCDRVRVLIVSMEMGRRQIQHRLKKLSASGEQLDVVTICKDDFQKGTKLDLNTDEGSEYLRRIVEAHEADIVFIDSLRKVRGAAKENDNDEMGRVLDRVEDLVAVPTDSALVVLHHMGKPGQDGKERGGRGASSIEDACSDVLYLDKAKGGTWEKTRDSVLEGTAFGIDLIDWEDTGRLEVTIRESDQTDFDSTANEKKVLATMDRLREEGADRVTRADVERATGLPETTTQTTLDRLTEGGKVDRTPKVKGRRAQYWLTSPPPQTSPLGR